MATRTLTKAFIPLLIFMLALSGCTELAIRGTPPKKAQASSTALARAAIERFWASFSEARYEDLPAVRRLLTAAYLETPTDPQLGLLLAHAHFWTVAERARLGQPDPTITDHLILAQRYFEEARRLAPEDVRIPGWLGGAKMALGTLFRDERLRREGYFMVRAAAKAFIEFNGFSLAYPLIRQPHDSPRFQEAVRAMGRNLEACAAVTRGPNPDPRRARVCGNTDLAPHNVEGFFIHFADLLLKNGEPEAARAMYRRVMASPGFPSWRFKAALDERLQHLEEWSRRMRDADPANDPPYLFNSAIACVVCHAR